EQDYSTDDFGLLANLATQAAPAVRVAQLVAQQQAEAQARERLEQELRVARLIQQTLLPKELPSLEGWHIAAYYQPARAVGGDLYDFINLPDGRLGLVIGDVTDHGVPAALVMATTRTILRAASQQFDSPGKILERANEMLCPDIPEKMFVTCLYAILDPVSGALQYANAGHDLPFRNAQGAVSELRATGMPLGLMPGMKYEEKQVMLDPGDVVLFYTDGIVEAHNSKREMFSFPRVGKLFGEELARNDEDVISMLLDELRVFTGADWEQEDDVTIMTLTRTAPDSGVQPETSGIWKRLSDFQIPSEPGNEREAIRLVTEAIQGVGLSPIRLERLKTAVGEATMNAIEHGNKNRAELPVKFELLASDKLLSVRITDQGKTDQIIEPETPNLDLKLEGMQSPRGWGLFLIKNLVDEINVIRDEAHHTVELVMYLGGENGNK
ncbi:MAG TPA: SpoIIE family protein phosphatase, partial [Anaerolineae bacterium]